MSLAHSVSGALYNAARYIPAADVAALGLTPGVTRQQIVGWVVWTRDEMTGGLDVREATAEESIAAIEELRAADLLRRRAVDPDAAEIDFATFALDVPEGTVHDWLKLELLASTSPLAADADSPEEGAARAMVDNAVKVVASWPVIEAGSFDRQAWQTFGGPNDATVRIVRGDGATEVWTDAAGRSLVAVAPMPPPFVESLGGAIGIIARV